MFALVSCAASPRPTSVADILAKAPQRPTIQEIDSADCGGRPSNPESAIRKIQHDRLLDPFSAVFEILTVSKGVWREEDVSVDPNTLPATARKAPFVFGWEVAYRVRAKNAFGAYTQPSLRVAFFRGEDLIADDSRQNDSINSMIRSAGYNFRVN